MNKTFLQKLSCYLLNLKMEKVLSNTLMFVINFELFVC